MWHRLSFESGTIKEITFTYAKNKRLNTSLFSRQPAHKWMLWKSLPSNNIEKTLAFHWDILIGCELIMSSPHRWPRQMASSNGLCRYGARVDCCWGWTRRSWAHCQRECHRACCCCWGERGLTRLWGFQLGSKMLLDTRNTASHRSNQALGAPHSHMHAATGETHTANRASHWGQSLSKDWWSWLVGPEEMADIYFHTCRLP